MILAYAYAIIITEVTITTNIIVIITSRTSEWHGRIWHQQSIFSRHLFIWNSKSKTSGYKKEWKKFLPFRSESLIFFSASFTFLLSFLFSDYFFILFCHVTYSSSFKYVGRICKYPFFRLFWDCGEDEGGNGISVESIWSIFVKNLAFVTMNCSIWWWLQENNKSVFDNFSSDRAQLFRHEFIITLDLCTANNYNSIVLRHRQSIPFVSDWCLISGHNGKHWNIEKSSGIKAFCSDKRSICLLVATLENSLWIDL